MVISVVFAEKNMKEMTSIPNVIFPSHKYDQLQSLYLKKELEPILRPTNCPA